LKKSKQNTRLTIRKLITTGKPLYILKYLLFFLVTISSFFKSAAQLCNGSLGDPTVNITFGSGPNPGPQLSAIGTGYTYKSVDCPNDGMYSIRNTTTTCFGNTWHSLIRDHTGEPQGYFMLVNASYQPSDFYVDTVKNLCANTTYEFAAWIMNIMKVPNSIRPNITFQIEKDDGTVLKKMNTGDLPETTAPQWKQYGFWFSTPPGVQKIVLRITNNAPGGIGNDLVLDDITFRPCGPEINAGIEGNGDTVNICENELRTFTLKAEVVSGYATPSYQWQVSTNNGTNWEDISGASSLVYDATPTEVGIYQYRLTVAEVENATLKPCRVSSNRLVIGIHPLPAVHAGPDRMIIKGTTTTLSGIVNGNNMSYSWSPSSYLSDPNSLNPAVATTEDMQYTLTAQTPYGCTNNDVVWVKVANELFIPNAFTPNNDGINDTWRIPFLDPYLSAEVMVFNRYGQVVYHSSGQLVSWDGTCQNKPLPSGTYVYLIQIKKDHKTFKGLVTIVR
jgi:gliding motility-associated-like protein